MHVCTNVDVHVRAAQQSWGLLISWSSHATRRSTFQLAETCSRYKLLLLVTTRLVLRATVAPDWLNTHASAWITLKWLFLTFHYTRMHRHIEANVYFTTLGIVTVLHCNMSCLPCICSLPSGEYSSLQGRGGRTPSGPGIPSPVLSESWSQAASEVAVEVSSHQDWGGGGENGKCTIT